MLTYRIISGFLLVCSVFFFADSLSAQLPQRDYGRHPGRSGALTEEEMTMARRAWKYFERNYQDTTGLVNAVDKYPSTTMWDIAGYMAALVAVREMGIITPELFDVRITKMFATFQKVSLFRDELPNKCYNTITAQKVNYGNQPMEIGFSAIDLARFLLWSKVIKERYEQHSDRIDDVVLRWKFKNVIDSIGILYGASLEDKKDKDGKVKKVVKYLQEGRLGYEEYSAKCFQLWGFETGMAAKAEPYDTRTINGIEIPYDTRDPRELGAHNYVVSESYVLDGIELNWDSGFDRISRDDEHTDKVIADFAQRIYKVQEERFRRTGIMTARTEHQLDGDPYFVYDAIFTDGYPWNTITETGKHVPQYSAVALKGALGLWSLWQTKYTDSLFNYIKNAYDPEKGYYEGIFERKGHDLIKAFTMNNNGIMLETLLYKMQGKLVRFSGRDSKWDKTLRNREEPKNSYIYERQRKPLESALKQ
ncbi:MAG: DUF3131 domain-containing protein [Candidatus Kapaibacterium sp.]|nr:MAG: DUF3131 domain-containing protein [Candidatus Kapabacteria bacterium]